ncbi:MAG: hypothetical protein LBJ63_05355 [Prevotellaceae bacterium]|jgi:hypothetical protein|nr:hypothetical protein [Prevotellaceae bacterium]
MLRRTVKVALPERQHVHNRRSLTCGKGSSRLSLPVRQNRWNVRNSFFTGSMTLLFHCCRFTACDYENYILSGRQNLTGFKNLLGLR